MDSPPETTATAAASAAGALPPNGRAELDATRSDVIATTRITSMTDFDLIII
jgi:hypothetical protein